MQSAPQRTGSALPGCCACLMNNMHDSRLTMCEKLDAKCSVNQSVGLRQQVASIFVYCLCIVSHDVAIESCTLDNFLKTKKSDYYFKHMKHKVEGHSCCVPKGNQYSTTDLSQVHCWVCRLFAYSKHD